MGGTGLLAVEAGTPVVPVWIDVERPSAIQGSGWPWRGAFTVYVGAPLTFRPGTSYVEATRQIETAVRALDPNTENKLLTPTRPAEESDLPSPAASHDGAEQRTASSTPSSPSSLGPNRVPEASA
jgi:1-acyl-sn-glycerol-3-phosphate acyltransferase